MSYLFIVVIGAIAGVLARQYMKGVEHAVGVDIAAGAIGACVLVLLSRLVGSTAFDGYVISSVLAMVGGIGAVFAVKQFLKPKAVPVRARARR